MKKLILILAILSFVISCKKADAPVEFGGLAFLFESPQPINDSELSSFPSKFNGTYMSSDSTFLRIDDNGIFQDYFFKFRVHRQKLDSLKSEYDLIDGRLITKDKKEKFDILKKGDSIELSQRDTDTLFRLSYNQKLKRINGQLVLSTRDSIFWKIKTITLEKDILRIKNIYLPQDLRKLDSVTTIKAKMLDSLSYLIKPTRKEFKNVLKIKELGYDQVYKKVSSQNMVKM
ncbi:hypothetical protein [Flavobacterium sharifuzzamanii]|uniref:hypothetical protein n=1 Tax=Flavobacterium sharifuzzamanii TaxID=2211133 RepID=UPI000DABBD3C|nr:hypothetical protein [Flavobacterium sharifuzzamanii]KAF2081579.1 hypothetical protein DMA14_07220 [Flavobacterium sharifuzzamanii]